MSDDAQVERNRRALMAAEVARIQAIPPNAGTGTHDRLLSAREAERLTKLSAPPPYRPGDLAWRCGFEHALRQAAAIAEAQGDGECDEVALKIRNMKPEAPK